MLIKKKAKEYSRVIQLVSELFPLGQCRVVRLAIARKKKFAF